MDENLVTLSFGSAPLVIYSVKLPNFSSSVVSYYYEENNDDYQAGHYTY